jgi:hypothetical protein
MTPIAFQSDAKIIRSSQKMKASQVRGSHHRAHGSFMTGFAYLPLDVFNTESHNNCPPFGSESQGSYDRSWPGRTAGGRNPCPPTHHDPELPDASGSFAEIKLTK